MYVLDSSAIIDLHDHFPPRHLRNKLLGLAKRSEMRIPEGVCREIKRQTDVARGTVEALATKFPGCIATMRSSPDLQTAFARTERLYGEKIRVGKQEYPGFWHSPSGKKSADGQVVAVAKILRSTAISDDKAIQRACLCEDVPCIGWTEFARRCMLYE